LVAFRDSHYHGKNVVVGIAGNFDEQEALSLSEKHFGLAWEKGAIPNTFKKFFAKAPKSPRTIVHYKETEQVQLDMGFHAFSYGDPRIYAATVLANILGGTMSSRLFISLRERQGLCYSVRASHQAFHDTGVFSIQSGLDKSRISKAIATILKELSRVKNKGVTAAELKRAKDYARGKMALQFEDSENIVSWYVSQEVLQKKVMTPEQRLEKLDAITQKDVLAVAQELFQTPKIHLAIIGPYKDAKDFTPLLKIV
jgi:predicted Zn-dependent peptidase